ncbi:MAG TPA: TetR/AcrR family transcriptional regulator, partial [Acidimicrobiales bacterium]|nr:TetR/AcrR family transcriptional regulator [Acidimicrobiales bacterium]
EACLSTQAFYRYFTSKDELMLALLDDGRRRLLTSLQRRMQRSSTSTDQVRAWVEGVLAQAADPSAAARTRPWVMSEQRLAELFPREQQASVDLLVGLLDDPVAQLGSPSAGFRSDVDERDDAGDDAEMVAGREGARLIYRLVFATLRAHLADGTAPTCDEIEAVVGFCLRGSTR